MTTTYADFLASKRRIVHDAGRVVAAGQVHPLLHDWQAEVVAWAVRKGRAALFEDCGLGKTFQQLEWARLSADTSLILAPLSVARQTVREAEKIDMEVRYVRDGDQVTGPGVWITNYEMAE
ncbi:MAG: helicase, partial [Chloroflexi bacterium]|nr:helicase [Chloroflexota bacterium]